MDIHGVGLGDFSLLLGLRLKCLQSRIRDAAHDDPRGDRRGVRRPALEISPARARALLNGRNLEVTLERLACCVLNDNHAGEEWFNQFNPGAGGCLGKREAADLIRVLRVDGGITIDIVELKEWRRCKSFFVVIDEILRYGLCLALLTGSEPRNERFEPYRDEQRWPEVVSITLHVAAPAQYFMPNPQVCNEYRRALDYLRRSLRGDETLSSLTVNIEVNTEPIQFSQEISREDFLGALDHEALQSAFEHGRTIQNPLEVLRPDNRDMIGEWIRGAFAHLPPAQH